MRRCMVCCWPLTAPPGERMHPHCAPRPSEPIAKPQRRPRARKESMGRQILRVAMELAGERWAGADARQRLQWKREAKLLIFSHVP